MNKRNSSEPHCPISRATEIVGDIWNLLIIKSLLEGTKRYNDIIEESQHISSRTLCDRLKKLTQEGIVERVQYNEIPPRVEYSLTKKGKGLEKIIREIEDYGREYFSE